MNGIVTFLTINGRAEEAANFYVSVFKGSKMGRVLRCDENGPGAVGSILTVSLELNGHEFVILNYGPQEPFTRATSFLIPCADQREIDELWDKFLDGGQAYACGWIGDKFGVTWQVCPANLLDMISDADPAKASRTMQCMQSMIKFDMAELEKAYAGD